MRPLSGEKASSKKARGQPIRLQCDLRGTRVTRPRVPGSRDDVGTLKHRGQALSSNASHLRSVLCSNRARRLAHGNQRRDSDDHRRREGQ